MNDYGYDLDVALDMIRDMHRNRLAWRGLAMKLARRLYPELERFPRAVRMGLMEVIHEIEIEAGESVAPLVPATNALGVSAAEGLANMREAARIAGAVDGIDVVGTQLIGLIDRE